MKPRLLVIELHHLGDAVLAIPFLRAAQKSFATTVLCRPQVADFLRMAVPQVEIQAGDSGWFGQAAAVRRLGLTPSDAAVCVWADARAHVLMLVSGAGRRAGFPMTRTNYYAAELPWRKRRLVFGQILGSLAASLFQRPLLTHPCQRPDPSQSHLENWSQLARRMGFEPDHSVPWVPSGVGSLTKETSEFLARQENRRIVLIHPGGRLPTKRWPYFQALADRLARNEDYAALIVQPPGESAPNPCGASQFLVPVKDFPGLIALCRAADAVVCNDSFPAHLAAALGKPVVSIFGSGNPAWFAPFRNADRIAATEVCPHRPCIDRCVMPSVICLESVAVDLVESQLRRAGNAG